MQARNPESKCIRCGQRIIECMCPACPVCNFFGCVDHLSQEEAGQLIRELRDSLLEETNRANLSGLEAVQDDPPVYFVEI